MTEFISEHSGAIIDAALARAVMLPVSLIGGGSKILAVKTDLSGFELIEIPTPTPIPSGSIMLFYQAAAPIGWTKKSDWAANASLIVGNTYGSGGSDSPTSWTTNLSSASHAITLAEMYPHTHAKGTLANNTTGSHTHATGATISGGGGAAFGGGGQGYSYVTGAAGNHTHTISGSTASAGSGSAHSHTLTQDTYTPIYQTVIAATKD